MPSGSRLSLFLPARKVCSTAAAPQETSEARRPFLTPGREHYNKTRIFNTKSWGWTKKAEKPWLYQPLPPGQALASSGHLRTSQQKHPGQLHRQNQISLATSAQLWGWEHRLLMGLTHPSAVLSPAEISFPVPHRGGGWGAATYLGQL